MTTPLVHASISVRANHVERTVARFQAAVDVAVDRGANATLAEAQRRVKIGATRKLHDGLRIRKLANGVTTVGVEGVREAQFVENGTVKMHAAPFLRPASSVGAGVLKETATSQLRAAAEG